MTFAPFAAIFIIAWLWVVLRNLEKGITFVIAVLPFGMFAAISLAGLSLLLANFLAMLTIAALVVRRMASRTSGTTVMLPPESRYLVFFAGYALFSAFILVRLFEGDFLVFPLNLNAGTTQVSISYPSAMWLLRPSGSNLSQSFYILLSCGFFLAAISAAKRWGSHVIEFGLVCAAWINIILGILDFLALDDLLAIIRTADYSLANQQQMAGFARVIGGFSEPASFAAASSTLTAYFTMSALIGRKSRDVILAIGNMVCTVLAFSSTGTVALLGAGVLILLHARGFLTNTLSRTFAHALVILAAAVVFATCLFVLLTPATDLISDMIERLILEKRNSMSGIERRAWAYTAFVAFWETWGLGAGAGSLRGNGLLSVLMGSVGLPGVIAFAGFLYYAVLKPIGHQDAEIQRMFYASRVSSLTLLCSMLLSATTADPTLLLMSVAALAAVSRDASVRVSNNLGRDEETAHQPGMPLQGRDMRS